MRNAAGLPNPAGAKACAPHATRMQEAGRSSEAEILQGKAPCSKHRGYRALGRTGCQAAELNEIDDLF